MTQRDRVLRHQLRPFCLTGKRKQLPEGAVCGPRRNRRSRYNNRCRGIRIQQKHDGCEARIRRARRVKSQNGADSAVQKTESRTGDLMAEPLNSGKAQPRPDPNERLAKVFDSEDESEGLVVKGLLESAGIDSDLTSASLVQDTFPGLGGMIILVREEDAEAARRVIAEHKTLPDDESIETETMEEPPQKG